MQLLQFMRILIKGMGASKFVNALLVIKLIGLLKKLNGQVSKAL